VAHPPIFGTSLWPPGENEILFIFIDIVKIAKNTVADRPGQTVKKGPTTWRMCNMQHTYSTAEQQNRLQP